VAPSSSAKKVAKLASRGKGKKIRFQGGSIFPIAVVLVVLLGLLAIFYGRQSRPADGSGVPRVASTGATADSHWHAAFGIYICDTFEPKIVGTLEDAGTPENDRFKLLGVHSHGDGVIHYHPYSTKSSGNRAKLGVFLDAYDIKLTDTSLALPAAQGSKKWSTKDTKCDGKDTQLKVAVWNKFTDTTSHEAITDFKNLRITNDGMVFVIAFVPKGTAIPQPPWGAELPTLGASDSGNVAPSSTIVGATTTIVGGSTPGTTPGTGPGASSVPVATDTTPSTTVAGATSTTGG
jgi:hypothetical protein